MYDYKRIDEKPYIEIMSLTKNKRISVPLKDKALLDENVVFKHFIYLKKIKCLKTKLTNRWYQ